MYLEFVLCSYIGGRGGDECIQLIKITKFLAYFSIFHEEKSFCYLMFTNGIRSIHLVVEPVFVVNTDFFLGRETLEVFQKYLTNSFAQV